MPKAKLYHKPVFVLFVLFLFSCVADDFRKLQNPDWNPELAIALVDSKFGIDRIVNKFEDGGFLTTDNQGVVIVVYNDTIFELNAIDVLQLDDFTFDLALAQSLGVTDLPLVGMSLKTLVLENGHLGVHIEDNVQEDLIVTLNMPKTTKNNVAFKETFTAKFNGGSKLTFDTVFDLSLYTIDLSGNGNDRNKLNINYEAKKKSNNQSVVIDQFLISFENMIYSLVEGYFGEMSFGSFSDSLKIDMFKNFKSGRIILESPKIDLLVHNGFGMPIHVGFANFQGNGIGGSSTLGGSVVNSGVDANAPTNSGSTQTTTNTIDSSNSNLSQFLAITPSSLSFSFDLVANQGSDSNTVNFLTNESALEGELALELPLKGSLDSVVFEDIYDFNTKDLKDVDEATFKLITDNMFPLGIYVQIYFLDENEQVMDSLIEDNTAIFRQAITDSKGFSIQMVREESYFTMGAGRFSEVKQFAKKIKIRAMLLTDGSDVKTVKIRETDFFDLKLGLRAYLGLNY